VTIGVKVWVNEWQADRFFGNRILTPPLPITDVGVFQIDVNTIDTGPDTFISDVEPVPIPQLGIKYKRLFVTSSYYAKTDFDFPTFRRFGRAEFFNVPDLGLVERTSEIEITGERLEWDAALGWHIHPYVAFLVGYKEINLETAQTITETDTFFPGTPSEFTRVLPIATFFNEIEISGPTLGIAGSVPIARGFGIYASYAHGFMDVDIKDVDVSPEFRTVSFNFDGDYDVAELGFSYTYGTKGFIPFVPLSAATVYAGYRYQTIETDTENAGDRKDITQGFAAGLNLSW
jgi:hypothetical protein